MRFTASASHATTTGEKERHVARGDVLLQLGSRILGDVPPASSSSTISVSEARIAVSTVAASLMLRFAASLPTKLS